MRFTCCLALTATFLLTACDPSPPLTGTPPETPAPTSPPAPEVNAPEAVTPETASPASPAAGQGSVGVTNSPASSMAPADADAGVTATLPVIDADGIQKLIDQTAGEGKVLVIDFWATWCQPCIAMFPAIRDGLKQLGPGVRSMTVTVDGPDEADKALTYLKGQDAVAHAYRIKPDSEAQSTVVDRLGEDWQNVSVPAILVFDRRGQLVGEYLQGGVEQDVLEQVREMVAKK